MRNQYSNQSSNGNYGQRAQRGEMEMQNHDYPNDQYHHGDWGRMNEGGQAQGGTGRHYAERDSENAYRTEQDYGRHSGQRRQQGYGHDYGDYGDQQGSGYGQAQSGNYGSQREYGYRQSQGRNHAGEQDYGNGQSQSGRYSQQNQGHGQFADWRQDYGYGSSQSQNRSYGQSAWGNEQDRPGYREYNSMPDYSRSSSYGQDFQRGMSGGGWGQGQSSGSQSSYGQIMSNGGQQQSFRGRGPKGYQRSDERLKELISEKLSDDHRIDASDVEIEVSGGEVTLKGTVDQRWSKHEIEEIVDRCGGVKEINNQIRVKAKGSEWTGSSTGGSQASGQTAQSESSRSTASSSGKKN